MQGSIEARSLAALGRAAVETGHPVLFVGATTLLAALSRSEAEGQLDAKLASATCRNSRRSSAIV